MKIDECKLDSIKGSNKTVRQSPSDVLGKRKRMGFCSSVTDPNQKFPKTRNVPLNEKEKKIWMDFKEFDKDNKLGLDKVSIKTIYHHKRPIRVDHPIVTLTGNFAVTAFNQVIEMYVKKGETNNIHDFDIFECKYLKMNRTGYYFYITMNAFEEGECRVFDAKVKLNWDDGSKSLIHFAVRNRKPRVWKGTTSKRKTHPGSWKDGSIIPHSGLINRSICRGYDYRTPWGHGGP